MNFGISPLAVEMKVKKNCASFYSAKMERMKEKKKIIAVELRCKQFVDRAEQTDVYHEFKKNPFFSFRLLSIVHVIIPKYNLGNNCNCVRDDQWRGSSSRKK